MHELSICESLVRTLRDEAAIHSFDRVRLVRLEIGPLAGVEPDALRFSFDVAARGTLAEDAALDIVSVPAQGTCSACGRTTAVERIYDPCPACGGAPLRLSGGTELRIKELEVD